MPETMRPWWPKQPPEDTLLVLMALALIAVSGWLQPVGIAF